MRKAMAEAEVGDDVYGEDPTVRRLEVRCAELLGKEAALFVPSGTLANQLAIRAACEPGDEAVMEADAHSFHFETGATAALAGVQVRTVQGRRGVFDADALEQAIRPDHIAYPRTRLVVVENTHNFGGGTVWPVETLRRVAACARAYGLHSHMDGARLMNAAVASGTAPQRLAEAFDSVSLCLSKGLGAPVGSVLAGSATFVERTRRLRKMYGGGMRQAGILAAAGLYALDHHVERLAEDHARARRLAEGLAALPGLDVDVAAVQTNIVFVEVTAPGLDAPTLEAQLRERGVAVGAVGPRRLRLVTHLDIGDRDLETALAAFAGSL
ncbi:MAG: aminotransferase class I/II-fold pyridoxal phosphate-dependent enzyme [Deltaproteobacteria bacterium]|nr:MAG: aminotransferase class I/II-fold pyridoxal phosphate-dependent enzyme [Deltaproteobacteria bacterium]